MITEENKPIFQNDDEGLFAQDDADYPDNELLSATKEEEAWNVLIIDDEEDVHQLTRFVLEDYVYQGKKLQFVSAYSAEEAKVLIQQHPDTAVILLDVVMETNDAGLKLVEYIRETQRNQFVRIILRTGQPGYAPEKQVIHKYDINDYQNKAELTDKKLFTVMTAGLRAYSDIMTVESFRQTLEEKVQERTFELQEKNKALVDLNQQLLQLNQEKNEFLGIAAHDLKNPLSSIKTLAELILSSFDEFPKQQVIEFVQLIESSSQKMFDLIKNLLDVNAIESGKMNLSLYKINLHEAVQVVVNHYVKPANKKEISLQYEMTEGEYQVLVDENAIFQILENLISNAVKYSPRGKNIYIRVLKNETAVRCEIQDEGPGLSEKDHAKLFGKFARLTPRPTGDEHSTGLGLFIVKKLVEAMYGKVWCETELEKGSNFIIEFQGTDQS